MSNNQEISLKDVLIEKIKVMNDEEVRTVLSMMVDNSVREALVLRAAVLTIIEFGMSRSNVMLKESNFHHSHDLPCSLNRHNAGNFFKIDHFI